VQTKKLIVIQFLTLDGVAQAPGGKEEDTGGGFQYGGWQMAMLDDEDDTILRELDKVGALLLGRKTYDIFYSYWPTAGKDVEWYGPFMNSIPKYVASNTYHRTDWYNSNLLKGDVAISVAKLKREAKKNIYMFGSGNLCQTLMRHGLIDEYLLMVYPIILGKGKRLFQPDGPKQDLELLESKITKKGVFVSRYRVKNES
jgi:dihydrofolate reductase